MTSEDGGSAAVLTVRPDIALGAGGAPNCPRFARLDRGNPQLCSGKAPVPGMRLLDNL